MNFSQNLKDIMQEKQITKYRLAKLLGVHQTTVKNWLEGKTEPKFDMIEKIANALNITTDDLMVNDIQQKAERLKTTIENDLNLLRNELINELGFEEEEIKDFSYVHLMHLFAKSLVQVHNNADEEALLEIFRSMSEEDKINCLGFIMTHQYKKLIDEYTAPDSSTVSDHEEGEGVDKTDTPGRTFRSPS